MQGIYFQPRIALFTIAFGDDAPVPGGCRIGCIDRSGAAARTKQHADPVSNAKNGVLARQWRAGVMAESDIPDYGDLVSLIPGGVPQFIDAAFNLDKVTGTIRHFHERRESGGPDSTDKVTLVCLDEDAESGNFLARRDTAGIQRGRPVPVHYSWKAEKALRPFEDEWLPVPVFRKIGERADGTVRYAQGPSNWARVMIHSLGERDRDHNTHRIVVAFDMTIEEPGPDSTVTHALTQRDVSEGGEYQFVADEREYDWFLSAPWVKSWIEGVYTRHLRREKGRPLREDDFPNSFDALSLYITLLQVIADSKSLPRFRLIDPSQYVPVEVDLVLDIGNARTCGILIETQADQRTDLNDSYVLELRDLSMPYQRTREPFNSRIEFALARFGNEALSKDSGRSTPAFAWPSVVRVGPEATRLSAQAKRGEGATGMSSPKRYLWDEYPRQQEWRFNPVSGEDSNSEPPVVRGLFVQFVNNEGTPIEKLDDPRIRGRNSPYRDQVSDPVMSPRFSRASLMMFLLSEVISQALVTINAPGTRVARPSSDMPRRLRSIILTMPTAMTIVERNILRRMAEWAVDTTWRALGWERFLDKTDGLPKRECRLPPVVRCQWDEASATQLVYLYNEIVECYRGDIDGHFACYGRPRPVDGKETPTLRVASIDIGGGTTDLIVTTYVKEGDRATAVIRPIQEFREGFNVAGDEIVRAVIEEHVIRAIRDHLTDKLGYPDAKGLLTQLLGGDFGGQSERTKILRAQFAQRVLVPIALGLLGLYETRDPKQGPYNEVKTFNTFFAHTGYPPAALIDFFEGEVRRAGPRGFSLADVEIPFSLLDIDRTVHSAFDGVIADLCEVVHLYDCDVLLLSGRTSCFPAVQAAVYARLPVPAQAIIPLSRYHIERWYPFRSDNARIADPKTTVAVGAVLCALAEGYTEAFRFQSHELKARSTCRYLGDMEVSGQIRASRVLLGPIDLDDSKELEQEKPFEFQANVFLGFRQLKADRWPATPLYRLDFASSQAVQNARGRTPYNVTLAFRRKEEADRPPPGRVAADRDEGEIVIAGIEARDGTPVRKDELSLRLQTLKDWNGYWIDTGVFTIV
jgi:hypothetical protein